MSMRSSIGLGSLSWGTWWASLLVWACTIVARDFGLIGCSEDGHLVGVEVGEGFGDSWRVSFRALAAFGLIGCSEDVHLVGVEVREDFVSS